MEKTVATLLLFLFLTSSFAQDERTPICDYPCAQEILERACGAATCPGDESFDPNQNPLLCSKECFVALFRGDLTNCVVDADLWRDMIDEDIFELEAQVRDVCGPIGLNALEAEASEPSPDQSDLDTEEIEQMLEGDIDN